jgi:dTDP-4-amino-4,6-dideoxygalactose transaminase
MLDLPAQYAFIREEIETAVARVFASQRFVLGPEVEAFEEAIARLCGVGHAVACGSGSDALLLSLMALGVGPGDAVALPAFTFFATAAAVHRLGARPVFVDIDPATYTVDPAAFARAAQGQRLRTLLPVHLYGQAAELDAILALGLPVVEDAAQALGALDACGRPVGSLGLAACFSFYPTKNLGAAGDAGIVTTREPALAEELRLLRDHGMRPRYHHTRVGMNSRLDALQAAVLMAKLPHLEDWNAARRANADHYDALFHEAGARDSSQPLEAGGLPLRTPVRLPEPARHVYHQYVVRVPAHLRDRLRAHLAERRIGTEVYYPIPLHLQACFAHLGYREGDLPVSEAAARETVALPIHAELGKAQREHVVASLVELLEREG